MRDEWFERLFGFREKDAETVYDGLRLDTSGRLLSRHNGRSFAPGSLRIPTLAELRETVDLAGGRRTTVREVVGDVMDLHADPRSLGTTVQAASQFNLLEMVSPAVSPAAGVSGYAHDLTQGPACAIACGAGTVYRNYFVPVGEVRGQVNGRQLDCLADLADHFDNGRLRLWEMRNGYCLANADGLDHIGEQLKSLSATEHTRLEGLLRIGIQQDTEVTLPGGGHTLTQVYSSALPIAYSPVGAGRWEPFARLVLNATYEATLLAGLENFRRTGNPRVYLTLVGGGAFGNPTEWIEAAAVAALRKFLQEGLDVRFVSYGTPNPAVGRIINAVR